MVQFQCHTLKLKVSRLKLYIPRHKWTMNEMLIFKKIFSLAFNRLIPVSFSFVKEPLKLLFSYGEALLHAKMLLRWIFCLENKKKLDRARFGE